MCCACRLGEVKLLDTSWYLPPMGERSTSRHVWLEFIQQLCSDLEYASAASLQEAQDKDN
jgi:hypothetical protein